MGWTILGSRPTRSKKIVSRPELQDRMPPVQCLNMTFPKGKGRWGV